MSAIYLRLLGQPSLEGPSGNTPLQATKPNALACYLAAQAGKMIPRSRIVSTFWEELPEADGRRTLTTTLGRLRRTHPEWPILSAGELLGWAPHPNMMVDTTRLAELARETESPPDLARAALAEPLWRGPFLLDFYLPDAPAFDQWLYTQRAHWEEQFLNLLHRLIAADAKVGRWERVAVHARQALSVNPLQERFHRLLMEALSRSGDRPAALAQFTSLQQHLLEELGVEPDRQTLRLREAILANALGNDEGQATSHEPLHRLPQPQSAQVSSLAQFRHLPAPSTTFIGRQADVAAVKQSFTRSRLLTLIGTGGVGKTRLSLQAASELLPARADGVRFVELATLADPELVPAIVASAFGLSEQPDRTPLDVLMAHLQEKQVLLVLDNCEHLIEACALLAEILLRSCAQLWILVTSREALGIAGEVVLPVAPFPESDAVALFVERATAVFPCFAPTGHEKDAIARICRQLDGIPLAIELAAVMVNVLSVDEIDARLSDRFALLNGGSRTAQDRHRTLRGAVDWSYDLLTAAERALLRRLSVFAGGFTLSAAEAICAGREIRAGQVLTDLRQLVAKSLVIAEERDGERRFRLLETIRQYGLERLHEVDEWNATCARHFDWFASLAAEAAAKEFGPERVASYAWFDREQENLRAALDWNHAVGAPRAKAVALAWSLAHYWHGRGYLREGRERVAQLLESAGTEPMVDAEAYTLSGYLATMHSAFDEVVAPAEQGLALWRELGNERGVARSLMCLGLAAYHTGDLDRAVTLLEETVLLGRRVNANPEIRYFLFFLAEAVAAQGDRQRARLLHEECVAISRATGGVLVATPLMRLARLAALEGDWEQAAARELEYLSLMDTTFNHGIAMAFDEVCLIAVGRGLMERAAWIGGAADSIRRSVDGPEVPEGAPSGTRLIIRSNGITFNRGRRTDVTEALARARGALGESRFAQLWSQGAGLSPEAALARAFDESIASP